MALAPAGRMAPGCMPFAVALSQRAPATAQFAGSAARGGDALSGACSRSSAPQPAASGRLRAGHVAGATGRQQQGGEAHHARAHKMEADLDAVMLKFKGLGQPRKKKEALPTTTASSAPAPASGTAQGPQQQQKKQQPKQQQQQQRPKAEAKQRPAAAAAPAKRALDDDGDDIDVERLWKEVDAAVLRGSKDKKSKSEDDLEVVPMRPTSKSLSASAAAAAAARPSTSSSNSKPFKGFGPSPAELAAAAAAAATAAAKQPQLLRIFLYSLDEASAKQAIADAGLQGRVALEGDVKKCAAVVTAKEGRNGKRVQSVQVGARPFRSSLLPWYTWYIATLTS